MRGDDPSDGRLNDELDAILRGYAEPERVSEPRIMLAQILQRAEEQRAQRRPRLLLWSSGAACALAIVLAVLVWLLRPPRKAEIALVPVAPTVEMVAPPPPAAPRTESRTAKHTIRIEAIRPATQAHPHLLPKLDVFPSPQPLTPQEQALVAFARHGPPAVQHAVLEDQQHWDDPIIVADLREQPLQAVHQQDR